MSRSAAPLAEPSKRASGPAPPSSRRSSAPPSVRKRLAHIEATKGVVNPFLTDSFGREHDYLRISLTEKCNLRCTYCMPSEGAPLSPKEHLLSTDEIIRLASIFVERGGVRKIRLTGGEPTIRRDLAEVISRLAALTGVESIGMTSNGIALGRKLKELVDSGLTGLNISLDTLDEHKFELMTRRRGHSAVLSAIKQAADLLPPAADPSKPHLHSLKLNVVVISALNSDEVTQFVELTRELPISVRFIEYMPFDGNRWSTQKLVPSADLLAQISANYPATELEAVQPGVSDTARIYRIKGYKGSFGFISSMTDHFCSGCSRLRIAADGRMKVCLFGEGTLSLRDMLRQGATDGEIAQAIGIAVKKKHFAHDGRSDTATITSPWRALPSRAIRMADRRRRLPSRMLPLHVLQGRPGSLGQRALSSTAAVARRNPSEEINESAAVPDSLTHISPETGRPSMVDITTKSPTSRSATATGRVLIPERACIALTSSPDGRSSAKGDVLSVAQLAGLMGAKRTSDLIPLCHPLSLTNVDVRLELCADAASNKRWIQVVAKAECKGATGVEMEALTAVSVACLTVWDMLKAVGGKDMVIEGVMVTSKSGGKSGDWTREVEQ